MTNWDELDWDALRRIRQGFLNGAADLRRDYWRSRSDLQSYDATFAQRIGWKWDAVILETQSRGLDSWPIKPILFDWGCGSGIATRRMLRAFGPDSFASVHLLDRSATAVSFAKEMIRIEFEDSIKVETGEAPAEPFVLLASHVMSELDSNTLNDLVKLAEQAESSFFVEPGTPKEFGALVSVREALRNRLKIIAPCSHQLRCGMLNEERKNDWCHNFTNPPSSIFQDSNWANFGKVMKIDLRSLPVSFLVLSKKSEPMVAEKNSIRVLGRPRVNKVGASFFGCDKEGVSLRMVHRRKTPQRFKELKEGPFTALLMDDEVE